MTRASGGALLLLLRLAWWAAVVLLVMQLVIWPGILDEPSIVIGSREGNRVVPRFIPLALIAWLFIGRRLIEKSRTAKAK